MIYEGIDMNAYSKMLNERFDRRVEVLRSKGYYYSKEHVGFAKTPKGFEIGNWISNGVIMHCEDFYFNYLFIMMITISVHSSFIDSAVYNEDKQSLRIEIKGFWYYYYDITLQKMYRFRKAHSKGQYFCQHIKGQYEVVKRKMRG